MTSLQKTSSVYGLVSSPLNPRQRRVTMLPGFVKPDEGHTLAEGTCALESCESLLRYKKLLVSGEFLVEVACSIEHGRQAGWFPKETFRETVEKKEKKKTVNECPECGGLRRKNSSLFDHRDDCLDHPVTKASRLADEKRAARGVCPHCGGPPPVVGRGFVHTQECTRGRPVVKKVIRPACPHCGGPAARGKGWTHAEDCDRPRPVAKVKEPKAARPACEACGGAASGRGWVHVEGCSKVKVYVPTGRPRGRRRKRRRC